MMSCQVGMQKITLLPIDCSKNFHDFPQKIPQLEVGHPRASSILNPQSSILNPQSSILNHVIALIHAFAAAEDKFARRETL